MFTFLIFEILSAVVGIIALGVLIVQIVRHSTAGAALKKRGIYIPAIVLVIAFFSGLIANKTYPPNFAMPAFMHSHAPGSVPASIPFGKIIEFFKYKNRFEKITDIGANPNLVPKNSQTPDTDGIVRIGLTAQEVIGEIAPGIYFNYWTYNNQVPCAMLNVSTHNSHGQYGLILVEPREGLIKVDKEFYVMQGELYTMGQLGKKGLVPFDSEALLEGTPNY